MPPLTLGAQALLAGALLSAVAAVAHLVCVAVGAPAYRFLGAGERLARAAEAGKAQPALVTLGVAGILFAWSAFALSGAGVITRLPLTRLALVLISLVYLGRAVAFPLLKPRFPENTAVFWWVSSTICGAIGLVHAYGTMSMWERL